jgi:hypothetical protein
MNCLCGKTAHRVKPGEEEDWFRCMACNEKFASDEMVLVESTHPELGACSVGMCGPCAKKAAA